MASSIRRSRTLIEVLLLCIGAHAVLGFSFSSVETQQRWTSTTRLNAATALPIDTISPPTALEAEECKVGVLLLNLGGPETGDDVEGL